LLLDEMYPAAIAEELRRRGHDVVSVHDGSHRRLEGATDAEIFKAAVEDMRALVTENVPDFRRLETNALLREQPHPGLVFTTDRRFPRGDPRTMGRLVSALDALATKRGSLKWSMFLEPSTAHAARHRRTRKPG
jgi:predicted nuclease of predicted toxin-antitoxin system